MTEVDTSTLEQGTDAWKLARVGYATASRMKDVIAQVKGGGPAASRTNYLYELVTERLTGVPYEEKYVSWEMKRGAEREEKARLVYEWNEGVKIKRVGFIKHPTIPWAGCSPDGLVGGNGGVEIKCPNTAGHLHAWRECKLVGPYYPQVQWCIECTGREWWDFVSFDDRVPEDMSYVKIRVHRDDNVISTLRKEVSLLLDDVATMVSDFKRVAAQRKHQ